MYSRGEFDSTDSIAQRHCDFLSQANEVGRDQIAINKRLSVKIERYRNADRGNQIICTSIEFCSTYLHRKTSAIRNFEFDITSLFIMELDVCVQFSSWRQAGLLSRVDDGTKSTCCINPKEEVGAG
jgi:hypothetical protein